ncbi:MAG TPA: hypothetical protein VGK27_10425 [Candidatus Deferrimicrobiaceae bacterium]|jgi:hypothetical protein
MRNTLILSMLLLVLAVDASFGGSITSPFRFRTLETEHFSVHFHDGLDNVAAQAARYAEEAHRRMAVPLGWEPAEKTQLVLVDAFDFPNGFASALPYNTIYIFPVPPTLDSTLGEYASWLEGVIVHEYAHILTSDPARGYSTVTRKIFGKPVPVADPLSLVAFLATAPPNTFLPRWWHEGMATWAESTFTNRGRDNSVYFDMVFRMDVLEGRVPTIDRINESLPSWPDGHMPYLYGSKLVSYIARTRGTDAPGKLSLRHAGRVPYALNGAPEQLFDRVSYEALYRGMVFDLNADQKRKIAALSKEPPTAEHALSSDGEELTHPRFSPDGKRIAWTRRDPHGHGSIVIAEADGTHAREMARRVVSDEALAWSPDGGAIYFCQAEVEDAFKLYQDLYVLDASRGRVKRLTRGLRLSEVDAAPEGQMLAAVVAGAGDRNLAILTPEEHGYRVDNVTALSRTRLSGPRWSPGGQEITYVATGEDGVAGLFVYDLATRESRRLLATDAPIAAPAWSPDGRFIVYVSGETGVFNLFACPAAGGAPRQVTHLVGGAFQPDVAPDGRSVAFSSYHASGFRIATVPFLPDRWRGAPGPSLRAAIPAPGSPIAPGANNRATLASGEAPALASGDAFASPAPSHPYDPLPTLTPRFWLPALLADRDGLAPAALTAGQDALARHTWFVEGGVGLSSGQGYFAAEYANDSFRPTLVVKGYSLPALYSDLLRRGDYWERDSGLVLSAILPVVAHVESDLRLEVGYRLRKEEAQSPLSGGLFRGIPVFEGRRDSLFATFRYTDALRYPYSISEEEGRRIAFTFRDYDRRWGSDLSGKEYVGAWEEFVALPFGQTQHHVVVLAARGGLATGDRTPQGAFQLGGPPSDLVDFPLRGYPSRFQTGSRIAAGSVEYRAPIRDLYRGPGTSPFFFDRVHGALFVDAGRSWGDGPGGPTRIGAGIEARLDMTLGYWLKIEPALGFAYGFDEDGQATVYLALRALSL